MPELDDMSSWIALVAPAGTPRAIVDRLQEQGRAIYADRATYDKPMAAGINPVSSTPEEFDAFFRKEAVRWTKAFKESGIKLDAFYRRLNFRLCRASGDPETYRRFWISRFRGNEPRMSRSCSDGSGIETTRGRPDMSRVLLLAILLLPARVRADVAEVHPHHRAVRAGRVRRRHRARDRDRSRQANGQDRRGREHDRRRRLARPRHAREVAARRRHARRRRDRRAADQSAPAELDGARPAARAHAGRQADRGRHRRGGQPEDRPEDHHGS